MPLEQKDKLSSVFDDLLKVFDEFKVSPEDGALLSMNLLFSAMDGLSSEETEAMLAKLMETYLSEFCGEIPPSLGRPMVLPIRMKNPLLAEGLDRTWGLDSALIDEEH
jgi:hypothetical protein